MRDEPWRRSRVLEHAARFRAGLADLGLPTLPSRTPIQPVLIGAEAAAVAASNALFELGFWVPAIRPPTVPVGTSRLRCTFSAAHTSTQVEQLLAALQALLANGVLKPAASS
jgi:8-amino-7-oxononanoate synthase